MREKEYTKTLQRLNEQIIKYLEYGFTPLNPKEHWSKLVGWRNSLIFCIDRKSALKAFKESNDKYKLMYILETAKQNDNT